MARGQRGHRGQGSRDSSERSVAKAYRCPDCDSDAVLTRDDLGIWHLTIRHDATCPTYRDQAR